MLLELADFNPNRVEDNHGCRTLSWAAWCGEAGGIASSRARRR